MRVEADFECWINALDISMTVTSLITTSDCVPGRLADESHDAAVYA
jgi:hypothetical protein